MKSLVITFDTRSFPQFNNDKPAFRAVINGDGYEWCKTESDALLTAITAFVNEMETIGESHDT